jgi:phosphate acetyltransferase/phosphate butyryltransferase
MSTAAGAASAPLSLLRNRTFAKIAVGDTLTIPVTVTGRDAASKQVRLACSGVKQDGTTVIEGEAEVVSPP